MKDGCAPGVKSGSTAGVCPPAQHCMSEGAGEKVHRSYFPIAEINTLPIDRRKQAVAELDVEGKGES